MSSEGAGSFQVCQPVRPVLGGVYRRSPSSPPVRRGSRNTALERGYEPIRGVVEFALILLFYQVWRMGVRFDDHGCQDPAIPAHGSVRLARSEPLRGRPHQPHRPQRRRGFLGPAYRDATGGLSRCRRRVAWPAGRGPKVRAAIAQVAARYQIPAELTGVMPPPAPAAPSGLTAMICGECCELNAGRGLLFGDAERQLMVSSQQNRHGP